MQHISETKRFKELKNVKITNMEWKEEFLEMLKNLGETTTDGDIFLFVERLLEEKDKEIEELNSCIDEIYG